MIKSFPEHPKGFAALITVLTISAIILTMSLSTNWGSLSELVTGFSMEQSQQAQHLADTCAEESYLKLKSDATFIGNTISLNNGTCVAVVSGSGTTRTIAAVATVGNFTRKITATVSLDSNLDGSAKRATITSWSQPSN